MRTLVVGFGSIGKRHARILTEIGCEVGVVSRRNVDYNPSFLLLPEGLNHYDPEYVIIANQTSEHIDTLRVLCELGFTGKIMVEKPLFHAPQAVPDLKCSRIAVAYNLRFHPLLQKLRQVLADDQAITASVYCGSYLPSWRPGTDYRKSYSSQRLEGGGVLGDLSHELDYIQWLFGPWIKLTSLGGHLSAMEIDSDDAYSILMQTKRCQLVTLHLNYLDRSPRREIIVNTNKKTVRVDLVQNSIEIDKNKETITVSIDDTYRQEHIDMMSDGLSTLCTLDEALETISTIRSIELATKENSWIHR